MKVVLITNCDMAEKNHGEMKRANLVITKLHRSQIKDTTLTTPSTILTTATTLTTLTTLTF